MTKQRNIYRIVIMVALITGMGFAISPKKADMRPCQGVVGDEYLSSSRCVIPYLDGRSPGDQIGMTWYDFQANGGYCQRIEVDDNGQAHIDWMKMDAGQSQRKCAWNARFTDGSYYGETPASNSWSGYVQIDVTQDANPDDQRTVVAYHYNPGAGYYAWIDIDGGNLWGAFPNDPKTPEIADHIWPYIAVTSNNNIVMATGDNPVPGAHILHLYLTTDMGDNWSWVADFDSCATISQFLRASENSGSHKVVFAWTQFITDSTASGQLDNNVWYILSTDDGVNWGSPVNLTNYQPYPNDSTRAYTDVNAIFDANDNLHIVWTGRRVTNDGYWIASKIFHWDEVSNQITVVSSPSTYYNEPGDWWIATTGTDPGSWRLPADQPQLVVDLANNDLYCLWHGNDDYNDCSDDGYFNSELYGSYSNDGGLTWTDYTNLTNTRTPGGAAGACDDEDHMTACPKIVNDSIWVTYIEDKDAGAGIQTPPEGELTENPVRCWVFPKTDILGVEENITGTPVVTCLNLYPNPVANRSTISYSLTKSGFVSLNLYDASGRLVRNLDKGYRAASVYNFSIATGDLANGTYFVIYKTPSQRISQSLVVVR